MINTVTCPHCGNTMLSNGSTSWEKSICPHCRNCFSHKDWFGVLSSWIVWPFILLLFVIVLILPESWMGVALIIGIVIWVICIVIGIIKAFN